MIFTIANGASESDVIMLPPGHKLVALVFPAAFTGTTVTLNSGVTAGTAANPLRKSSETAAHVINLAVSSWVSIDQAVVGSARQFKLVCSAQAAERLVQIITQ